VCGPKLPSSTCGVVFHCPGALLVSNVCKLLTTAPVEPSCSVGIGPRDRRSRRPSIPSLLELLECGLNLRSDDAVDGEPGIGRSPQRASPISSGRRRHDSAEGKRMLEAPTPGPEDVAGAWRRGDPGGA
jgi:hypothetical protein